jgi:acyl-CoA thioester hydrolase
MKDGTSERTPPRIFLELHRMSFQLEITVRFAETDAQGVAHHAAYLVWFETARVEYLRRFAGGYQALRDTGVEATTSEVHARYLRPVAFDDRLVIHTKCTEMRGARFRYEYAVERDGELVADGWTGHACVDARTMRPTRVPAWLVEAITRAEAEADPSAVAAEAEDPSEAAAGP